MVRLTGLKWRCTWARKPRKNATRTTLRYTSTPQITLFQTCLALWSNLKNRVRICKVQQMLSKKTAPVLQLDAQIRIKRFQNQTRRLRRMTQLKLLQANNALESPALFLIFCKEKKKHRLI